MPYQFSDLINRAIHAPPPEQHLKTGKPANTKVATLKTCICFLGDTNWCRALNSSGTAIKSDGNGFTFHNHRHFAFTFGILQHGIHFFIASEYIDIFHIFILLGIRLTGGGCVRSGVFAENFNRSCHRNPSKLKKQKNSISFSFFSNQK